ncbi:MAG: hypothetical protein HY769_07720 [Candidatus Stahlbacteria bacterium]|nr:hypothetical protein [Candidatus Stahlbacteria bacterium]
MKFIYSNKCTAYCSPGHPESPERVKIIYDFLKLKGAEFVEPLPCSKQDILLAHTPDLLHNVREGQFIDPDTPALANIYEYARLATGGAILASEVLGFSIMRPPGHHAGKNYLGGFCYFKSGPLYLILIVITEMGLRIYLRATSKFYMSLYIDMDSFTQAQVKNHTIILKIIP